MPLCLIPMLVLFSIWLQLNRTNAATAVPWAIVGAIGISGILGTAIMIVLAFYMGTDVDAIVNDPIGQPMASILFNSLGQKGTMTLWAFVVLVQYMMGSSTVSVMYAFRPSVDFWDPPSVSFLQRLDNHLRFHEMVPYLFHATCTG